jgi:hypothetical protein
VSTAAPPSLRLVATRLAAPPRALKLAPLRAHVRLDVRVRHARRAKVLDRLARLLGAPQQHAVAAGGGAQREVIERDALAARLQKQRPSQRAQHVRACSPGKAQRMPPASLYTLNVEHRWSTANRTVMIHVLKVHGLPISVRSSAYTRHAVSHHGNCGDAIAKLKEGDSWRAP